MTCIDWYISKGCGNERNQNNLSKASYNMEYSHPYFYKRNWCNGSTLTHQVRG